MTDRLSHWMGLVRIQTRAQCHLSLSLTLTLTLKTISNHFHLLLQTLFCFLIFILFQILLISLRFTYSSFTSPDLVSPPKRRNEYKVPFAAFLSLPLSSRPLELQLQLQLQLQHTALQKV
ncbi:hypothetical protein FPOAC2_00484 [Fusarium poae]